MGKVTVDVDTEKKTMAIKVDGKSIANVREVYAYQGFNSKGEPDGFSMSVTAVDGGNEDIRKVTTYLLRIWFGRGESRRGFRRKG